MKKMSVKCPIRKKSFLLFELLISLALIVLCLFPLVKPYAYMQKGEKHALIEMQLACLAQQAFCYLKEDLYNHRLSWDSLVAGTSGKIDEIFFLVTGPKITRKAVCSYKIQTIDDCNKISQKKMGLLLAIELEFTINDRDGYRYQRTLYLERVEA
jgi:hypothetical protein